jgi:hypothetical protein
MPIEEAKAETESTIENRQSTIDNADDRQSKIGNP